MTKYIMILAVVMLMFVACNDEKSDQPSLGPDDIGAMIDVPAGSFQMGCNEAVDTECYDNEKPYHEVTLLAYKIGKYEVTNSEYQKCVAVGSCSAPHYDDGSCQSNDYKKVVPETLREADKPVVCVDWNQAKGYCIWIGGRLPTEAEWEKVSRSTDGRKYPWGNDPPVSCDQAVMSSYNNQTGEYENGCGTGSTMVVGSKPNGISPYGAHDIMGNVREWVNDWYSPEYYESSPSHYPQGPDGGSSRVFRGGSWDNYVDNHFRASFRFSYPPEVRYDYIGFRCAK